jgi:hypothetical protein
MFAARGAGFRIERVIARAGYPQHAQLRQPACTPFRRSAQRLPFEVTISSILCVPQFVSALK